MYEVVIECSWRLRERSAISYDVPATLEKWPSLKSNGDLFRSQTVFTGMLAGCVRQFMMKPISQRPLY